MVLDEPDSENEANEAFFPSASEQPGLLAKGAIFLFFFFSLRGLE